MTHPSAFRPPILRNPSLRRSILPGLAAGLSMTMAMALAASPSASGSEPLTPGQIFFRADFESTNAVREWSGAGRLDAGIRSQGALVIERAPGAAASATVSRELPVEAMRGCLVRGSAQVRAEGVSAKPNSWNGIKVMLAIETPDRKAWPQAEVEAGTFEWRRVAFTARIPTNATMARLILGLEQVTGRVWFDEVQVAVVRPPRVREARPVAEPVFTGREVARLRGAMISPDIDAPGLRVLGREWGANLIRWQLIRHGRAGQRLAIDEYDGWLEGELKKLDAALPVCEEVGLHVVVDLHSPPGGTGDRRWVRWIRRPVVYRSGVPGPPGSRVGTDRDPVSGRSPHLGLRSRQRAGGGFRRGRLR